MAALELQTPVGLDFAHICAHRRVSVRNRCDASESGTIIKGASVGARCVDDSLIERSSTLSATREAGAGHGPFQRAHSYFPDTRRV
jgi:hypothetical protein